MAVDLGELLVERQKLADADLQRARRVREGTGEGLDTLLVKLGLVSERDLAEALAGHLNLPLVRPGVFAGGVFAFIVSFDQFPVSLFLVVPKGETLPVVLFNYMKFDLDGAIAAASMVSILLALAVVVVLERLIGLKAYVKL